MDNLITDRRLIRPGILHGMTLAKRGHMKPAKNKRGFFESLKISPERMLYLKQVHGVDFSSVFTEKDFQNHKTQRRSADGWILGLKNCGVAVHTADCLPIFLWDKNADILALAHCGWRSIAEYLPFKIAKHIMRLKKTVRPLSAFIAPHIQKCCFEVGPRIAALFPKTAKKNNPRSSLPNILMSLRGGIATPHSLCAIPRRHCEGAKRSRQSIKNGNRLLRGLPPPRNDKKECRCEPKAGQSHKFTVDLASEVRYQLIAAGIAPVDIKISSDCTCCNGNKYFSYRRTGKKLSMMSFVFKR